jgi:hypothetical protein
MSQIDDLMMFVLEPSRPLVEKVEPGQT